MGDSITDGWQQPRYGGFFPGKPYVDRGISGQTTPQMLIRFRRDVIDLQPKAVVILAGTNDIAGNTGPMTNEEIQGNLASMRAAQPRIRELTMPDFSRAEDRESYLKDPWTMRSAATGSSRLRSRYQFALTTLLVVVALVVLVACTNIAHLQLARAASRCYDYGVRIALGAPRLRIVRLQAVESFLLAVMGAGLGLACANWAGSLVVAQLSTWASTAVLDLSVDWRVLVVTATTATATALLFGIVPAIRAGRADPLDALNRRRRGVSGPGRVGDVLVVAQIALSMVLVVGAALFVRSFAALMPIQ